MVINAKNMDQYSDKIDTMTSERERLEKEVTECLLLAPKEATRIPMKVSQDKDNVKIRADLKPDTVANDATPVKFRIWTKEIEGFF